MRSTGDKSDYITPDGSDVQSRLNSLTLTNHWSTASCVVLCVRVCVWSLPGNWVGKISWHN